MNINDKETQNMANAVRAILEKTNVSEAKKWKLTSMSQDEAIKEFGKKNVRLGRKNGLGRSTVEVYTESIEAEAEAEAEAEVVEAVESVDEATKLSSKEEAVVLKLMSSTKTAQEAAKKVEKEMKIPYKEALEIVRKVMKQYESVEEATDLEEAFIVYIPKQKINGKLIPKSEIKIDATAKDKAIKMAAKKLGTDFLALKIDKVIKEEATDLEEAGDKEAYRAFFNKAMKKFGIDDITDLKGDKKKEFFDYVDANWKADNEVEESTQIDEAFLRLPGEMINGELPMAIRDLESILKGLRAGNDFDKKGFNKQMARLTTVKKAAKKFNSQDEVPTRYQYTKVPPSK